MTVTQLPSATPGLPRRDAPARAHLAALDQRLRPTTLAADRRFDVLGPLGALVPSIERGTVVTVDGNSGRTSTALALANAVVAAGEWGVALDDGTLGGLAVREHGLDQRFAVVRDVSPARWAAVIAVLIDGLSAVVAFAPPNVRLGDARRLVARTRERDALLVIVGNWPADAALRLHVEGSTWSGLGLGDGVLDERALQVRVEGRGVHRRPAVASVG